MKRKALSVCKFWPAAFVAYVLACTGAEMLTPGKLHEMIQQQGAKQVVAGLAANGEKDWEFVLKQMDLAGPGWLDLVPELKPGTDASYALGLRFAMGRALPKAPQQVLTLIARGKTFSVQDVCDVPYIEPDDKTIKRYLQQAKAAVSRVAFPGLQKTKAECLKQLAR